MSSRRTQHELKQGRRQLRDLYTARQPGASTVRYRQHTITRKHADSQSRTWQIIAPNGEVKATVDIDIFEEAKQWLQFVDAVVRFDFERATEWFDCL
ncbi:hypothetical protein [Halorussus halophilus]|uniref:hypothetical protein n=1 Tax=Halorussus halophilus TaxID=2650975 RepID=UPI00130190FF|nr:hypothetical protein [Halorussus halophilus]